jgi:Tfp pilus assembly protein PilX
MSTTTHPPRSAQRGFGTLGVALMLLLTASVGVLYLNRSVLFEQRTSANQMQATSAHEVAEAALEWATGMLNAPYDIGTDCNFLTTTNLSFRKRYVLRNFNATPASTDVAPATTTYPGCKINPSTGATSCSCPAVPASGSATASLGSAEQPSFTVAFEAVSGDTEAVKITAYACNAQASACSSSNFASAEGNARLSVILKMRPLLRAMPSAPLTCGTSCTVGGSFNVVNQDVATNGILINAGTSISTAPGTSSTTLQGQPSQNAMVANDSSLSGLSSADTTCSNSGMFNAYFGTTVEKYRASPETKILSCTSASDCKSKLDTAYNDGWRSFFFDSDLQLSGNNTYGTQADPITLVTNKAIKINGNNTFYGMIFSNSSDWNDIGTGSAVIYGAQVACAAYNSNGNGTVSYDPETLKNARRLGAVMVRVPGSWRDFKTNADTLP